MPTDCLTPSNVLGFCCPDDQGQVFLWDTVTQGLGVRATPRGQNTFVFQRRLGGKPIRKVIGGTDRLTLVEARNKALEIQSLIYQGAGPGQINPAEAEFKAHNPVPTFGQLWEIYLQEGRPAKRYGWFSTRYQKDLKRAVQSGSELRRRGNGQLKEGPLYPLMHWPIEHLNEEHFRCWYEGQTQRSVSQAARALVMLRGFLRWCQTRPEFRTSTRVARDAVTSLAMKVEPAPRNRPTSTIDPCRLPAWWAQVQQIENIQLRVYFKILLMTGLRSSSIANLTWQNSSNTAEHGMHLFYREFRWRLYPITEEVFRLIKSLPKRKDTEAIFWGTGKSKRMPDPRSAFKRTLILAGIESVPLSTIKRTFALLAVDTGVPPSVVAQYMNDSTDGSRAKRERMDMEIMRQHLVRYEQHLKQILGVDSLV